VIVLFIDWFPLRPKIKQKSSNVSIPLQPNNCRDNFRFFKNLTPQTSVLLLSFQYSRILCVFSCLSHIKLWTGSRKEKRDKAREPHFCNEINAFMAIISWFEAGVHMNLSKILVSLKRGWKGKKGLWNTTRQLPDPTVAPQVVGQPFGVYLPILNFKF